MVEKRNAERPKPEITSPVVEPRVRSGKVLAVELTALVRPPLPPAPVMKLNRTRVYNPNVDRDAASSGIPSS